MKKTLLMAAMLLAAISLNAQTAVSRFAAGAGGEGTVYYLPRTAVLVDVLVEKTHYQPGQFAQYAERFLRMRGVGLEEQTSWRVLDVRQRPIAEVDTAKAFQLRFDARSATANLSLSDQGLLLAVNDRPRQVEQPKPFTPAPKRSLPDAQQYLTQDILLAGSKAKMAELTAEELFDVRENRALLVKGQADFMPKDGQQLKLMLNELNSENEALTSLFAGITQHDTMQVSFVVSPSQEVKRHVVFRFSEKMGVVEADNLVGAPYYISISNTTQMPEATAEQKGKAAKRKPVENGLYVNVPGQMVSTIERGIEEVDQQAMPAPQFGSVELLDGALFNKKFTTRLRLNPLTGAVEHLEAELPENAKK
jgi:hypothetical protein